MLFWQICTFLKTAEVRWIDDQKVPYAVKGNEWVGYDNKCSYKHKVRPLTFKVSFTSAPLQLLESTWLQFRAFQSLLLKYIFATSFVLYYVTVNEMGMFPKALIFELGRSTTLQFCGPRLAQQLLVSVCAEIFKGILKQLWSFY